MKQPTGEQLVTAAQRLHHREGEVEVDDNARISRGMDEGAYVAAWVWVPYAEAVP